MNNLEKEALELALENSIKKFIETKAQEDFNVLLDNLLYCEVEMAAILKMDDLAKERLAALKEGETLDVKGLSYFPAFLRGGDGKNYVPIFSKHEYVVENFKENRIFVNWKFSDLIQTEISRHEQVAGFVLNPFNHSLVFPKDLIVIINDYIKNNLAK